MDRHPQAPSLPADQVKATRHPHPGTPGDALATRPEQLANVPVTNQKTVLIAEDDVDLAKLIGHWLEGEGIKCRVVNTLVETMQVLRHDTNREIGLLLLGWGFAEEEANGAPVLQYRNEHRPELPVIVMSGNHGQSLEEALSGHADEFLAKPFDLNFLLGCVRKWLNQRSNGQAKDYLR